MILDETSAPLDTKSRNLVLAVVTETWHPDINGVALSIHKIISGLLDLGVQIQLYYIDHDGAEVDDRIRYFPLKGFRLPFYHEVQVGFPCSRKLYKYWSSSPPDIVQIVTEGPLGYSAMKAAKRLNIPSFSDYHTNFQQYTRSYHLGIFESWVFTYLRYLHNQTSTTLVPTQQLCNELQQLNFKNVAIMRRGVDVNTFNPKYRKNALRQTWGINDDTLVVLYVGRLAAEKNISLAAEAYRAIQTVHSNTCFVLVGGGPLRNLLEKENPDFIFCGMKTGQDLAEHYASGDIFLSPSVTETFGNIVLEAMASKLAIVSFDYAAAREHIRHGENGLKAPFRDNKAFIEQAVELASKPEIINTLGDNAFLSIQNNSWHKVSLTLLKIIGNHINESRSNELITSHESG